MKRENLHRAQDLIKEITHLEECLKELNKVEEFKNYGFTGVSVNIASGLQYTFPPDVPFSMFHNILKTSIELSLQKANEKLEEC